MRDWGLRVRGGLGQKLTLSGGKNLRLSSPCRFLYGKNVDGTAFVIFGVQDGDRRISLAQSLTRVVVRDRGPL